MFFSFSLVDDVIIVDLRRFVNPPFLEERGQNLAQAMASLGAIPR